MKALAKGDTSTVIKDEYTLKDKYEYKRDSLGNRIDSTLVGTDTIRTADPLSDKGPLLSIFTPSGGAAGAYSIIGTVEKSNRSRFLELVNKQEVQAFLPTDMEFRLDHKPIKNTTDNATSTTYAVYAIKNVREHLQLLWMESILPELQQIRIT